MISVCTPKGCLTLYSKEKKLGIHNLKRLKFVAYTH